MKIEVTETHIREGVKGSAVRCPIALAIKEAYIRNFKSTSTPNLLTLVSVKGTMIRVRNTIGRWESFMITPEIHRFIMKFDFNEPVEPFSFELEK